MLTLSLLPETFAICRLPPSVEISAWATRGNFFAITRTRDELSMVCPQSNMPDETKCERDWRALKVEGVMDLSLVGVLASLATPLAYAGIAIFAISTFDTDYLLVKEANLARTIQVLREAGHQVE
ncbi:MAG: ACT domain-containing protein [Chloroflexi bacterium]|nr:ACT domain-containing protein [Chloroflexota bacterium]